MKPGLNKEIIAEISASKKEPAWLKAFRLAAYDTFCQLSFPAWGPKLSDLNLEKIYYYQNPLNKKTKTWSDLPEGIKQIYDQLGLKEAEQKYLAGLATQYESEIVYKSLQKKLKASGVIFTNIETGWQKHQNLFQKYFAKLVNPKDNLFAALNSAVFSGGVFLYVPRGVKVDLPLSAYFRINRRQMGQFERTLIIVEEGGSVQYLEGCSAPLYDENSLHAGVVEAYVGKNASLKYSTVQNWSKNVYNLVTKRATVAENGTMQWVDGNIGSFINMKYPTTILKGNNSRAEVFSLALASGLQIQDTGAKMIHLGKNTSSRIVSKSICRNGGKANFFSLVKIAPSADNAKSKTSCHSLLLDKNSAAQAIPKLAVANYSASAGHEASVAKLEDEKIFYLRSRGLSPKRAEGLLVNGFMDDIIKEIPFEFAVELNRLINLEFQGNM